MDGRSFAGRRHILVTGASGGLGGALARAYSSPDSHITLWGRNADRLAAVACACEKKSASVDSIVHDSRDFEGCRAIIRKMNAAAPVDVAFMNAGVSSGIQADSSPEPAEDACRTMEVNAAGNINMAGALLEGMLSRGGHLVFICSLAALYPLPSSPAYSASKAALSYYARALRMQLAGGPVRISMVYPGYVESPMSDRLVGNQPLRWSAEKAALHIATRLEAGKDSIAFPFPLTLGLRLLHFLPFPLASFFLKAFSFTVSPDPESPAAKEDSTPGGPPHV